MANQSERKKSPVIASGLETVGIAWSYRLVPLDKFVILYTQMVDSNLFY